MSTSQSPSLTQQVDLNWQPLNEPGSGGLISSVSFNPNNPNHILIGGDMLGVGLSLDGGQSWQRPDGFTTAFEIEEFTWNPANPNIVWAATREGPYRSQDGGRSWQPKREGMPAEFTDNAWLTSPIQKIIYGDHGHLLAFGGNHREFNGANASTTDNYGAVWESRDHGESWSIRGRINPGDTGSGYNIKSVTYAADKQTLYAAVESRGVYRSQDQGATWQRMNGGQFNDANDIAAHPNDPGTLWVSTDTGLYKTRDGGATWSAINNGINANHVRGAWQVIEVAPSDPNVLMAGNYRSNAIYRSQDGGASWQPLQNQPDTAFEEGITPHSLSFDPNNADRVIIGTFVTAFISEDQGNSWFDATSQRADVGANEWKGRGFAGWVGRNIEWNPYKPNQVTFQGMDEGTLWLSDDLEGWRTLREQPNGALNSIEQFGGGWDVSFGADGKTIYTTLHQQYSDGDSKRRGIAKSQDGGKTWAYLNNQPGGVANKTDHAYEIHALPGNPNHVWVRVDQQLWQSQNGGNSWNRINLNGANVVDMAAPTDVVNSPANALIYVATQSGVYQFKDNRWTNLGGPGDGEGVELEVDPHDSSRLYLANWNSDQGGLYRFENGSWDQLSDNRYVSDVAVSPRNPDLLIATTNQNPYKMSNSAPGMMISRDRGQTWEFDNDGLGVIRAQTVEFSPDGSQVVVGTTGGGFFISNLDGSAPSSSNPSLPETPPPLDLDNFSPLQPAVPPTPVAESPSPIAPAILEVTPAAPPAPPHPANDAISLRVEVEDYQDFQDSSAQNEGGAYRNDAVDIQTSGDGGYSVGWIRQGEWLTYQLDVAEAGNYQIVARGASLIDQAHSFKATVEGQSTQVDLTGTGGWKNWQDFTSQGSLSLKAGQHELRLDMQSDRFNLNYLDLVKVEEPVASTSVTATTMEPSPSPVIALIAPEAPKAIAPAATPATASLRIEAEDYKDFSDTTEYNFGNVYRNDAVDIQNSRDIGGGYSLGWIRQGEWLTYEFNAPAAGKYQLVARGASLIDQNHRFQASIGQQNINVDLQGTGGWQNWQDFTAQETLSLTAGQNTLRLDMLTDRFNLNYLDLVPVQPSSSTIGQVLGVSQSTSEQPKEALVINLEDQAAQRFNRDRNTESNDPLLGNGASSLNHHSPESNHAQAATLFGLALEEFAGEAEAQDRPAAASSDGSRSETTSPSGQQPGLSLDFSFGMSDRPNHAQSEPAEHDLAGLGAAQLGGDLAIWEKLASSATAV